MSPALIIAGALFVLAGISMSEQFLVPGVVLILCGAWLLLEGRS